MVRNRGIIEVDASERDSRGTQEKDTTLSDVIKSLEDKIENLTNRMERGGDCNVLRAERRKLERTLEALHEAASRS